MSHAVLAWRLPCLRVRSAQPGQVIPSSILRFFTTEAGRGHSRPFVQPNSREPIYSRLHSSALPRPSHQTTSRWSSPPFRSFNTSSPRPKNRSRPKTRRTAAPSDDAVPDGVWRLSRGQIARVFGTNLISPVVADKALRELQRRRVEGTLDLDLPPDIKHAVPQPALDKALEWLRNTVPMDEDAAILRRVEKEEQEAEDRLIRRAEELGLYKPQSGYWGAEKVTEGDVYGQSVLEETRKANIKRAQEIEAELRRLWLEGEAKDREQLVEKLQKVTQLQKYNDAAVVEAKPRADPKERPFLAWVQKHHLAGTSTDVETPEKLTKARRILPSLGVVLLTLGLCALYSETYHPPPRDKRLWPNIPPAATTVLGIVGINTAVFLLWKMPPAWKMLNKYFISVPLLPRPISMLGNVFSHHQLSHLGINMAMLWFIGTRLHDEIGRGDFLALYASAGVLGSFTSLAVRVLGNNLAVSSLGASGAIAGLLAAWCMLHANDKFTLILLPPDLREILSASGSTFLAVVVIIEFIGLMRPLRIVGSLDHWAHLGGYASGALLGWHWKKRQQEQRMRKRQEGWRRYLAK